MAIVLLNEKTINRIAAGEVIERPASVIKELVENAIDAGSTEIEIKIESGGRNLIFVTDNGVGINKNEIELAFTRHATSKLKNNNDLIEIKHLGFRGEALPSIAAISRVKLSSKAKGVNEAWSISYEGGKKVEEIVPYSLTQGTHIEVRDLFFATPNRLKFLKTERAETQHIIDIINNLAIINYDISFTLTAGNKKFLEYTIQPSLFYRLCEIEEKFQDNSLEIYEEEDKVRLTGHICKSTINRGRSDMIYTFVNKRPIKDNLLVSAIRYAYHDLIPSGRYPFAILHLEIPYDQVDVNVHPNKSEVRFQNKKLIYEIVRRGLIKALSRRIGENNPIDEFVSCDSKRDDELRESEKEFYEKRPSAFENSLMRQFNSPAKDLSEQSESYDYFTQLKTLQVELIDDHPLGFARCQLYNTYVIAQAKDRLIIVDQHAAHERLVYEYMKDVVKKSVIQKQSLLIPEIIDIRDQAIMEAIESYKDDLSEMGFYVEVISDCAVIIKEIPVILGHTDIKEIFIDLVERLGNLEDTLPITDKINKILATIACHGSIRAGRKMKLEEMNELLRQIEKTPYSNQCNHGRPTYIEMKLSDIEKLFKRR